MIRQQVRVALLAGGLVAATALTARADDCTPPAKADCAPQYRTVCVNEWVPEKYETTRTVYRTEQKTETYTAYRCETVPETKTRTYQVCKMVPETREETRKVCVTVPTVEERTVMKACYHWVNETKVVRKCVDKGHYECQCVPCEPSCFDHMRGWFRHRGCGDDCCEPCHEVKYKTKKVWVPCPVWEEHTVCCKKRVCEYKPETCKVTVCKHEWREEKVKVTVCKPVMETKTETYTCCVTKHVPYQATRTICVCVPHQEKVNCTRMVCHKVEKQVPCEQCCETSCCKHRYHRCCSRGFHHHDCCD